MSGVQALASALYRRAAPLLPRLHGHDRDAALAALDAFVANPVASTFLAARRELAQARRRANLERLRRAGAGAGFRRGLASLGDAPGASRHLVEQLAAVPVDGRAGMRLQALAALMAAHHELLARAEAAAQAQREALSGMQRKSKPGKPRRPAVAATPAPKRSRSDA